MDLSGRFQFSIPWIEDQSVVVTRHGAGFILRLRDRFDRYRMFESRYIGYNVTEFKTRSSSIPRIVVYGKWEQAQYIDERGRHFEILVNGAQKKEEAIERGKTDQRSEES